MKMGADEVMVDKVAKVEGGSDGYDLRYWYEEPQRLLWLWHC